MTRRLAITLAFLTSTSAVHAQASSAERARAFAALPNWTGLWETDTSSALISGEIEQAAANRSADQSGTPTSAGEAEFLSRTELFGKPPYNPEWERRSRSQGQRHEGGAPPPFKVCDEGGFPAVMDNPTPDGMFEAVVTPEETLFLFPDGEVRRVYTDGRSHPKDEDLWPTAMGDSIGHWENATLVIDTIARKAGPIAAIPLPGIADLSGEAHFTERVRMIDANNLQDDLTIDDPKRFEHPWNLSFHYRRIEGLDRMIGVNCTDNERNPIVDGKLTIAPP